MEKTSEVKSAIISCFLASFFLQYCFAEKICSASSEPVVIKENNTVDVVIVSINTTTKDVTLNLTENPGNAFALRSSELVAKKGLDFEMLPGSEELSVQVRCIKTGVRSITLPVLVRVININDNPPAFVKSEYTLEVNELIPVNNSVGLIEATDDDSEILYYTLQQTVNRYFRLESMYTPNILVNKVLDYDVIQQLKLVLYVQDTPPSSTPIELSYTASTTITINIKDIDNRPPWFQPCTRITIGNAKICLSLGYRGRVNLTEKQDGPLQLLPGPVYARDGDKSRNEDITYKIARGNDDNLFQIDEITGNITMLKPADIVGPISLLVLASQVSNRDQFATTSITIEIMKKSRNPPKFEKERYEAYVYSNSGPDNMVLRDRVSNRPLRVRARDEDFANGLNPDIRYEVQYSSYVNITTDGFILLKKAVRTDSFALQLRAVDSTTGEAGTAALSVIVVSSAGVQSPEEGYKPGDMALLGFVMAALLVLCLIVIGYLISRIKKGHPDAFKLSECLGPCLRFAQPPNRPSPRDSMQFTNDGFLNEGDTGRSRSRHAEQRDWRSDAVQAARVRVISRGKQKHCKSCGLQVQSNHTHHGSPAIQSKGKANKGKVKSILAKEKRGDDKLKTVWFKERKDSSDIEVEIIPDIIGLKPEESKEEGNLPLCRTQDSEMELDELTVFNVQDLNGRNTTVSDSKPGLQTERRIQ